MKKEYIIVTICFVLSIVSGILSHDLIIGGLTLFTALLCAYYSSEGKRSSYIWGLINYLLIGYTSLKNHLHGLFLFGIIICPILQIQGFISWGKHLNDENTVRVREFTLKNSIIITISCIIGSLILSYLLTLIPNEQIPFMDAASNTINLCAVILGILRFKECWWIWIVNNTIDLIIWIIMVINQGSGAIMMLLVSIGYLVINIYGIIKWQIEAKKNS